MNLSAMAFVDFISSWCCSTVNISRIWRYIKKVSLSLHIYLVLYGHQQIQSSCTDFVKNKITKKCVAFLKCVSIKTVYSSWRWQERFDISLWFVRNWFFCRKFSCNGFAFQLCILLICWCVSLLSFMDSTSIR